MISCSCIHERCRSCGQMVFRDRVSAVTAWKSMERKPEEVPGQSEWRFERPGWVVRSRTIWIFKSGFPPVVLQCLPRCAHVNITTNLIASSLSRVWEQKSLAFVLVDLDMFWIISAARDFEWRTWMCRAMLQWIYSHPTKPRLFHREEKALPFREETTRFFFLGLYIIKVSRDTFHFPLTRKSSPFSLKSGSGWGQITKKKWGVAGHFFHF